MPRPDPLGSSFPVWHAHPPATAGGANRSHPHRSQETCPCSIEIASLEGTYLEVILYSDPRDVCGWDTIWGSRKHQKESYNHWSQCWRNGLVNGVAMTAEMKATHGHKSIASLTQADLAAASTLRVNNRDWCWALDSAWLFEETKQPLTGIWLHKTPSTMERAPIHFDEHRHVFSVWAYLSYLHWLGQHLYSGAHRVSDSLIRDLPHTVTANQGTQFMKKLVQQWAHICPTGPAINLVQK